MADAVPLGVAPAVVPFVTLDALQLKAKMVPLSMTAFVATGNEHLSPLAVSGAVESRTPSPSLPNRIKREASLNDVASPVVLAPKSPPSDVPAPPSPQRPTFHSPPQSVRHSPWSRSSAPIGREVLGRNTAHADNQSLVLCLFCLLYFSLGFCRFSFPRRFVSDTLYFPISSSSSVLLKQTCAVIDYTMLVMSFHLGPTKGWTFAECHQSDELQVTKMVWTRIVCIRQVPGRVYIVGVLLTVDVR
jgi:hypothetical protein